MSASETDKSTRKSTRRFVRFSLRGLLIVMTVLCIWGGITVNRVHRQKRAVEAVIRDGGYISYHYQSQPDNGAPGFGRGGYGLGRGGYVGRGAFTGRWAPPKPPGPKWLREWLGDHYFVTPVLVQNRGQGATDENSIAYLKDMPSLETLSWREAKFEQSDFEAIGSLHQLRKLFVYYSNMNDEGLSKLKGMTNLEMLGLSGTEITDAGLAHLASLPKLTYLSIAKTKLTDDGISHLEKMTSLREIELFRTNVTREGVKSLQSALPGCQISH